MRVLASRLLFLACSFPAIAQPRVAIVLHDAAGLCRDLRIAMQNEASRVFRAAGVETDWRDSGAAASAGEVTLTLRLLPGYEIRDPLALGGASLQGGYAQLYPETITTIALSSGWTPAELMGHVAAHEIGHLLLGSSAHSNAGIMRPLWDAATLRRLTHAGLVFLPDEARALRIAATRALSSPRAAP